MPIKKYTAGGNYDLVWDSDKLTATVNGQTYNKITGFNGRAITEAERLMLKAYRLESYQAREVYSPGVGTHMHVMVSIVDYGYNYAHEHGFTLEIGESE